MQEYIQVFYELQKTTKKKEKESIIKNNQKNQLFLESIQFLCDANVITGISKKKLSKKIESQIRGLPPFLTWSGCIDYLKRHNTGTDNDIYWIQLFIQNQPEDEREFYEQMITKSFRPGCDYKTVNKALGYDLIKTWEVQQAYPLDKYPLKKKDEWFSLSQKLNGNHCSWYKGKLISRQGKEFTGLQHIIDDINKGLANADFLFLDGELIRKNNDGLSDAENFQIGTGIINSDLPKKEEIEFVIYELMPVVEFDSGESECTYKERKRQLESLKLHLTQYGFQNIKIVDYVYEGTDQSEIQKWLDYADEHDWEGLMLNKDTKYQCKRNSGILKVKSFLHCDVTCKRIDEGDGKNKGTLGAIVVDYKGFECGVGSGFTDELRRKYWSNPDEIINKIVQIKYKTETKNKDGGLSMQFPIFECVRDDKTEPSYN